MIIKNQCSSVIIALICAYSIHFRDNDWFCFFYTLDFKIALKMENDWDAYLNLIQLFHQVFGIKTSISLSIEISVLLVSLSIRHSANPDVMNRASFAALYLKDFSAFSEGHTNYLYCFLSLQHVRYHYYFWKEIAKGKLNDWKEGGIRNEEDERKSLDA